MLAATATHHLVLIALPLIVDSSLGKKKQHIVCVYTTKWKVHSARMYCFDRVFSHCIFENYILIGLSHTEKRKKENHMWSMLHNPKK